MTTNSSSSSFPVCSVETHACECPNNSTTTTTTTPTTTGLTIFTWQLNCLRLNKHAQTFTQTTGIPVHIECITAPTKTRDEFHHDILSDAKTQTGLYDGYTLGPHLFGDLDLLDGLFDLTPLVRNREIGTLMGYKLAWNDILLFARENGAVYDKKLVGIPMDGDVHSLFYRTDLFDKYNQTPPATWDEYTQLAKFFHGRQELIPGTNTTVPITGSCVGKLERTEFWVFLILSSMTQHAGTNTGAFFDANHGMEPLLGEAFVKTLQFMEEQFVYGAPNEYQGTFADVNLHQMNQGRCAMTYNWGDAFTEAAKAPPASLISGYLGTAHTPGSHHYLDRTTQTLQQCTPDTCVCGNAFFPGRESDHLEHECINVAPYAAFTGWSGACSNFTSDAQKRACAEFMGYISSPETSLADTIPNITMGAPVITVDPYRISQTNLDEWVQRGLPEQSTKEYLTTIKTQLSSPNVVLDMRFPAAADFQSEINAVFRTHLTTLQQRREAGLQGEEILSTNEERWLVEQDIRARWKDIIETYDRNHPSSPLLESYQRNLGVYVPPDKDSNTTMETVLIVGAVVIVLAVLAAGLLYARWEQKRKNEKMWMIRMDELTFDKHPRTLGRGTFGVVLLAEYRGTKVAVKRVISNKRKTAFSSSIGTVFDELNDESRDLSLASTGNHHNKSLMQTKMVGKVGARKQIASMTQREFRREMLLLSRLRHPCITTVMGAVIMSQESMMVMEWMHWGSLHDLLHNKQVKLDEPILINMLIDVACGLRFLHSSNPQVVHGDLKAKNVLCDEKFRAKVADFGLAPHKGYFGTKHATGTPLYMAPELIRGVSYNTPASDVYSYGMVLYEVFSRKYPYEGEVHENLLRLIANKTTAKRPTIPRTCPNEIASLMTACWEGEPLARPEATELEIRLRMALADMTADAPLCPEEKFPVADSKMPPSRTKTPSGEVVPFFTVPFSVNDPEIAGVGE